MTVFLRLVIVLLALGLSGCASLPERSASPDPTLVFSLVNGGLVHPNAYSDLVFVLTVRGVQDGKLGPVSTVEVRKGVNFLPFLEGYSALHFDRLTAQHRADVRTNRYSFLHELDVTIEAPASGTVAVLPVDFRFVERSGSGNTYRLVCEVDPWKEPTLAARLKEWQELAPKKGWQTVAEASVLQGP